MFFNKKKIVFLLKFIHICAADNKLIHLIFHYHVYSNLYIKVNENFISRGNLSFFTSAVFECLVTILQ